jgi:hypothetical protein
MKGRIIFIAMLLGSYVFSASAVVQIENYMGSCEIKDSALNAHFTYILETGYEDGYSNKGIQIQFADKHDYLTSLNSEVQILNLSGFEDEVKIKNSWNKLQVEKSGNLFGGVVGELKIYKIKKSGKIEYQYKCYSGSNCGEYEVELEFKNCDLEYKFNGKKIL